MLAKAAKKQTLEEFVESLDKSQRRELKADRAQVLICANCGEYVYYGAMPLISLGISNHKPACSYACNKALGQV